MYHLITREDFGMNSNMIEHQTIQYVEDCINIITTDNSNDIEAYINIYFKREKLLLYQ